MRVIKWTMFKLLTAFSVLGKAVILGACLWNLSADACILLKKAFFELVGDVFLKTNKDSTLRPHYYAFKDEKTNLLWVIPCSSQIEKYQTIIKYKNENGQKHNHIQIIKVNGIEQVFLYQDMFPVLEKYIESPYKKQNAFMEIKDPKKNISY